MPPALWHSGESWQPHVEVYESSQNLRPPHHLRVPSIKNPLGNHYLHPETRSDPQSRPHAVTLASSSISVLGSPGWKFYMGGNRIFMLYHPGPDVNWTERCETPEVLAMPDVHYWQAQPKFSNPFTTSFTTTKSHRACLSSPYICYSAVFTYFTPQSHCASCPGLPD